MRGKFNGCLSSRRHDPVLPTTIATHNIVVGRRIVAYPIRHVFGAGYACPAKSVSISGHSGSAPPPHCATMSFSTRSMRLRSAIFARTSSR